jgi:RNA polymerase sigma-70 factor (ECF subfamily)
MEIWEEISADRKVGAERLVAEYGDRLYTAACCIVQNASDAEDLVFRTFECVVSKIGQFESRSSFFSWMYSVMLNFRRMDLRRKGANALVFDGEIPETESLAPDPCEALAAKAEAEAVRAAVDCLAEPLRTVVTLRYFEDFDLKEIAALLDLPLGTVKFRLYRARKELAQMLSQTFSGKSSSYQT